MKNRILTLSLFCLSLSFNSCIWSGIDDDGGGNILYQSAYSPIYMSRDAFENTTNLLPVRSIENSGKIYVKGAFLFINEMQEGFHIIDNASPENPENIGFLKVIGSSDMSIKNNSIYIDNASDLIALRFSDDYATIEITKRIINTFPNPFAISPDGFYGNYQEDMVIIGWELTE